MRKLYPEGHEGVFADSIVHNINIDDRDSYTTSHKAVKISGGCEIAIDMCEFGRMKLEQILAGAPRSTLR